MGPFFALSSKAMTRPMTAFGFQTRKRPIEGSSSLHASLFKRRNQEHESACIDHVIVTVAIELFALLNTR
jgi:hypothetical protein